MVVIEEYKKLISLISNIAGFLLMLILVVYANIELSKISFIDVDVGLSWGGMLIIITQILSIILTYVPINKVVKQY
jgi:hypothetical protein